ncbi:MAG: GNAT family N-acetyltransferase [Alphaproteobacteria bacterium]
MLAVPPPNQPGYKRVYKDFAVLDHDPAGEIRGAVYVAYQAPGWGFIKLIWVKENERRRGLGQKLMKTMEEEAAKRECRSIYLWTYDFEAPEFYEKLGYTRYAVLEDFIPGHQRLGFMKRIAA